jgi:hypothetical protein
MEWTAFLQRASILEKLNDTCDQTSSSASLTQSGKENNFCSVSTYNMDFIFQNGT